MKQLMEDRPRAYQEKGWKTENTRYLLHKEFGHPLYSEGAGGKGGGMQLSSSEE